MGAYWHRAGNWIRKRTPWIAVGHVKTSATIRDDNIIPVEFGQSELAAAA